MDTLIGDRAACNARQVGFKFARQSEMRRAGLPVPAFFCVSAQCFAEATAPVTEEIERLVSRIRFDDYTTVQRQSEAIRALILDLELPKALVCAIEEQAKQLFPESARVSVRSSLVAGNGALAEDSQRDALAGLADSFLYVPQGAIASSVKNVWASAFNAESLLYRHARGAPLLGYHMAVGVQQMIEGRRSFVLFTRDPRSGARLAIIAAGYGIGEGVVQEKVAVDHFFVSEAGIERQIAHKPSALECGTDGDGVTLVDVPEAWRQRPALEDREVEALVDLGKRIEDLFDCPQDIEGTLDAHGRIYILQARPITMQLELRQWWSNANITESFGGTSSALTYTFAQKFYAVIFRDLYRRLGVTPELLQKNESHLQRMIGRVNGRIYYCLLPWYQLHRQLALFPLFCGSWQRMMGIEPEMLEGDPRIAGVERVGVRAALRMAASVPRFATLVLGHGRTMNRFESWWQSVAERRPANWATLEPLARIQLFRDIWREVAEEWGVTLINDALLGASARLVERAFGDWLPKIDPGALHALSCGNEDNASVRAALSLLDLVALSKAEPELLTALSSRGAEDTWRAIEQGEFGIDVRESMRRHIERYGDRTLEELKLEQPSLRQEPWRLLLMLQGLTHAASSADLRAREDALRGQAEDQLKRALGGKPHLRAALRWLLQVQRDCTRHRENSRYCRAELFGITKDVCRSLGIDLVKRGVLRSLDDVYHLTLDELFGYFDGTGVSAELQGLADVRRGELERNSAELPVLFSTLGSVRDSLPAGAARSHDAPAERLCGIGSSGGRVRGTARVVLDPHAPIASCSDMILIARETDPGWLFLMLAAKGIVVERGTLLSHTAITGRKFGIPTVVSVQGATKTIADGASIEIDGTSGEIAILAPEEAARCFAS